VFTKSRINKYSSSKNRKIIINLFYSNLGTNLTFEMLKGFLIVSTFITFFFPQFLNWYFSISIEEADDEYDFIIGKRLFTLFFL